MKAFKPPETPNNIYCLEGTWVRPMMKPELGTMANVCNHRRRDKVEQKCGEAKSGREGKEYSSSNDNIRQGNNHRGKETKRPITHSVFQVQGVQSLFQQQKTVPCIQKMQNKGVWQTLHGWIMRQEFLQQYA